ncbi:MAG: hypothetical protein LBR87_07875 [Synergistaceae bacterium]|jgi:nitrogen regulatory protein PII|nr:hypothetical protein [Synergistaceae bacterium]
MSASRPLPLKLLSVIVDRGMSQKVADILKEEQVRFHFITLGEGTAGSDILALLGLNSVDKSLMCCLVPEFGASPLIRVIADKVQLSRPGRGIAFTIPLSGVSGSALQLITKDFEAKGDADTVETVKKSAKYDMILSIINQGHVDELMTAAKGAGARGGTVLHGRKCDIGEDGKFFGISPQMEKDIVAILTNHEKKNDIMKALAASCGMSTEAQGLIFSLPVDEIEGLRSVMEEAAKE